MEVLEDDSPCTGVCRMEKAEDEVRCISCRRTYQDLERWIYLTRENRLERMKQLKQGK
jgi:predicted Fe-S protein YdhL (DUF1289 family)